MEASSEEFMDDLRVELQRMMVRACSLGENCLRCAVSVSGYVSTENPEELEVIYDIGRKEGCALSGDDLSKAFPIAAKTVSSNSGFALSVEAL